MQICVTLLTPSYHFTLFFHFPSSPGAPSIAWATAAFAMPLGPHTLNFPAILSQPASGGFWHWASIQEDSVLGTLQAHFQDGGREGWQCQGSGTNKLRGPSCPFPNHLCKRTSPLVSHIHFPCIPEEDEELGLLYTGSATLDFIWGASFTAPKVPPSTMQIGPQISTWDHRNQNTTLKWSHDFGLSHIYMDTSRINMEDTNCILWSNWQCS